MDVVECSRFLEPDYFRRLLLTYCRYLMVLIVVHDTKVMPVPELNLTETVQYSMLTSHAQRKEAMYYRIQKYIPVSAQGDKVSKEKESQEEENMPSSSHKPSAEHSSSEKHSSSRKPSKHSSSKKHTSSRKH